MRQRRTIWPGGPPPRSRARRFRWLQLITGVHRIHDIRWSYGWKLPFVGIARFENYGWKRTTAFHDCSRTGVY